MTGIPDSIATTTAREVVKTNVLKALQATVADLLGSGQIEAHDALTLTHEVSKALLTVPSEVGEVEVLKSLGYGAMTTDAALLGAGAALTLPSMSEYQIRRAAKALYRDTLEGDSPVSKAVGYEVPLDPDDFRMDIADCFMQEFGMNEDDGLSAAGHFFDLFKGR